MEQSNFSERAFSIPFEVLHYVSNGEVLNGLPSETHVVTPKGAPLANFRLSPQIDKFHFTDESPEYVGLTLTPWPGTPVTLAESEDIYESDCYYFGSLNRPALQLLANDEQLNQSSNEVFQKIDYALSTDVGIPTFVGIIGYGSITMNNTVPRIANNLLTSEVTTFGTYDAPEIRGNNTSDTQYAVTDHRRQSNLISEPSLPAREYSMNIALDRPMYKGDSYLITVETSWAFSQYSKMRSDRVHKNGEQYFNDVDFIHAQVVAKSGSNTLFAIGTVGLVSSYEYFEDEKKGKSYESKRYYHAFIGSSAPSESGSIAVGKCVFTPEKDYDDAFPLNISLEYNAVGNHGERISKGLRDIYVSIRAI